MFPAELATGLCSLNPHVDRLVQSCFMEVDRRGAVVRYEFHDGVINSNERMTYTAVHAILTDRDPALMKRYESLVPTFELMRELFHILNDARRRRGSIDFDLNEAEVIMDSGGMVEAINALQRNVAHRLIEEFMLLANETVASYLDAQGAPGALPHPRGAGHPEGRQVRGLHFRIRLQPGRAVDRAPPASFPEADRTHPGQAGGEADRVPDAAHDAEGAVRAREPRALRPRRLELHALHVADPAVSRSRRAPRPPGGASRRARPRSGGRSGPRICRRSRGIPPRWSVAPRRPSASCCSGRR